MFRSLAMPIRSRSRYDPSRPAWRPADPPRRSTPVYSSCPMAKRQERQLRRSSHSAQMISVFPSGETSYTNPSLSSRRCLAEISWISAGRKMVCISTAVRRMGQSVLWNSMLRNSPIDPISNPRMISSRSSSMYRNVKLDTLQDLNLFRRLASERQQPKRPAKSTRYNLERTSPETIVV